MGRWVHTCERMLPAPAQTLRRRKGTVSYARTIGGNHVGQLDVEYVVGGNGDAIGGLPVDAGGVLACSLHGIGRGGRCRDRRRA